MTADRAQTAAKLPPRCVIRTAWVLHRALYRFSGGRVGLSRPTPASRFGMLRLTTVGRRSGQPRVAIVGYYEDGPNLVTLAMNGWAEAEPAWWLNLQAHPDTVVELDGRPACRASPRRTGRGAGAALGAMGGVQRPLRRVGRLAVRADGRRRARAARVRHRGAVTITQEPWWSCILRGRGRGR